MMILVFSSLSMTGVADVTLNGSSGWQNTTLYNETFSDVNNIVSGIFYDTFTRADSSINSLGYYWINVSKNWQINQSNMSFITGTGYFPMAFVGNTSTSSDHIIRFKLMDGQPIILFNFNRTFIDDIGNVCNGNQGYYVRMRPGSETRLYICPDNTVIGSDMTAGIIGHEYGIDTSTVSSGLKIYDYTTGTNITAIANNTYSSGYIGFSAVITPTSIDNVSVRNISTGNATHYRIDAGSGNVVSGYNISAVTPVNTNYTLTYIDNVTKVSSVQGTGLVATNGWINGTITGTKYQIVDFNLTSYGNDSVVPEEISFTAVFEAASSLCSNSATISDLMFLVNSSECWQFTSGLTTPNWTVNNVLQSNITDLFNWTVPNSSLDYSKNIYEIRAYNDTQTVEWLVSSLTAEQAPNIIDSFSDGAYNGVRESDPWGRTAANWTLIQGSVNLGQKNLNFTSATSNYLVTNSTVVYGTWLFTYRQLSSDGQDINFYPIANNSWDGSDYNQKSYRFEKLTDNHLWLDYLNTSGGRYPVNYKDVTQPGSNFYEYAVNGNDSTHTIRIVHDTDGTWRMWQDDIFVPYSTNYHDFLTNSTEIAVYVYNRYAQVDSIKVWNTSIYPAHNATFDGDTIFVDGWNNNLSTILSDINNSSVFNYSSGTSYSNYNITLVSGSLLNLDNESLYFNTTTSKTFRANNGFNLYLNNSNIYRTNSSNTISFDSADETFEIINGYTIDAAKGTLKLTNSSSIYFSGMLLTSLRYLDIQHSSIYATTSGHTKLELYSGADYYNIDTLYASNDAGGLNTFYQYIDNRNSRFDTGYYGENGQFLNMNPASTATFSEGLLFTYYLDQYTDILVNNATGSPINNATITIISNVSGVYPLNMNQPVMIWAINPDGGNWYDSLITNNNISTITTGIDGHTKLPEGNESNTLILRRLKAANGFTYYNYTVTVNDSTYIYPNINTSINSTGHNSPQQPVASTTISPNSSWYRPNPNTYQNTTTIQLPVPTNWSIKPDTTISVNASSDINLTASWLGTATVLFNTTTSWTSTTLYLKHDGTTVDTKTSNATGFVNFTYTGTNGNFNVSNSTVATVTEETTTSAGGGGSSGSGGSGWAIEKMNKTKIPKIQSQHQEEVVLSLSTNNFTFYYKSKSPLTLKVYDISFISECEAVKLTLSNTNDIVSINTSCKITNPNIRFIIPNTQSPDSVYYKAYDKIWINKPSNPTDITADGRYLAVRVESGEGQYKFMQYNPLYEVQQVIDNPTVVIDILKEMDKELYVDLSKRFETTWSYWM